MTLNSSWYQAFVLIGRWLAFRLDLISATSLAAGTLMGVALRGRVSVSLLGLALSYTLQLPGLLQWTVRQSTEVGSGCWGTPQLGRWVLCRASRSRGRIRHLPPSQALSGTASGPHSTERPSPHSHPHTHTAPPPRWRTR
jgi:hypothetical protein